MNFLFDMSNLTINPIIKIADLCEMHIYDLNKSMHLLPFASSINDQLIDFKRELNKVNAKSIIQDSEEKDKIINAIVKSFEVSKEELYSKNRTMSVTEARYALITLLWICFDYSVRMMQLEFRYNKSMCSNARRKAGEFYMHDLIFKSKMDRAINLISPELHDKIVKEVKWANNPNFHEEKKK